MKELELLIGIVIIGVITFFMIKMVKSNGRDGDCDLEGNTEKPDCEIKGNAEKK